MVKYVECMISSERYKIEDCHPWASGYASKAVMAHYGKMKRTMRDKGLILKLYQYREFCGYPERGMNVVYKPPSNNEYQQMETQLRRELE